MYCQLTISATSQAEARSIARKLVEGRLVAGTMINKGDSYYRWQGEVVEKDYWKIEAYSLMEKKQAIIEEVEELHSDDCPIVAFNEIEGNQEFLD